MLQKGARDGKCYVTTEAHGLWSVHAAAFLGPDAPVIFLPLLKATLITSPGQIHETSAQGWCTGKNQKDGMGKEVGGGNTCKYMADSCPCMAKPLQYCKAISLQLIKINGKKILIKNKFLKK